MPDTFSGKDTTIEVTPRRVSIIRKSGGSLDIEIRAITAVVMHRPRLVMFGRFEIHYAGAPSNFSNPQSFHHESYADVAFTLQQEDNFKRLRALIHEYQDASS